MLSPTNKVCTKCKVEKTLHEFHRDKKGRDGRCWECKACAIERASSWQREHAGRVNAANRARYKVNPAISKAASRAWSKAHPESGRASSRKWRNAHLAMDKVRQAAWHNSNKALCASYTTARKAQKLMAMPGWANKDAIRFFYAEAAAKTAATGLAHHVDHIVPLQSNRVCGLHVEHNLRVIPASANVIKGNRVWSDMS